jgi:hypothetical protein
MHFLFVMEGKGFKSFIKKAALATGAVAAAPILVPAGIAAASIGIPLVSTTATGAALAAAPAIPVASGINDAINETADKEIEIKKIEKEQMRLAQQRREHKEMVLDAMYRQQMRRMELLAQQQEAIKKEEEGGEQEAQEEEEGEGNEEAQKGSGLKRKRDGQFQVSMEGGAVDPEATLKTKKYKLTNNEKKTTWQSIKSVAEPILWASLAAAATTYALQSQKAAAASIEDAKEEKILPMVDVAPDEL